MRLVNQVSPGGSRGRLYIALAVLSLAPLTGVAPVVAAPEPLIPGNTRIESFSKAKKHLERVVYPSGGRTLYCDSWFAPTKDLTHDRGYVPQGTSRREHRLEWEHVVPAHSFGQRFEAWRVGSPDCVDKKGLPFKGRNCARKVVPEFRFMEADLYNLYPSTGANNQRRSNYRFSMLPGEPREFGSCDFEVADRKVEPRPEVRGEIARTYFYMASAYGSNGILSQASVKLFDSWRHADPVSAEECRRTHLIERLQGNENPYVKTPCRAAGLWPE